MNGCKPLLVGSVIRVPAEAVKSTRQSNADMSVTEAGAYTRPLFRSS